MSIIEHIVLFSILFGVYAFWGKYQTSKQGFGFWKAALVPIALYTGIVGSRYGWGVDYLWYRYTYENAFTFTHGQVAFDWLNQSLSTIGVNYVGAFMVYGFIFIIGAFILLRSYGVHATYMYCFLIPATLNFPTAIIRQGVGLGFIFLAIVLFHQRKWIYMAIAVFIAFNIHSATIITFAAVIGIYLFIKKPIHYLITIPLCLFLAFVFDGGQLAFIGDLVSNISLGNQFQSYIDKSDIWFGEGGFNETYTQSIFARVTRTLFYIALIYLGYIALKAKENKHVMYMYNTVVLGILALLAVYNYEILRRFAQPMELFYFIPLGYVLYVYFNDCKQPKNLYALRLRRYFPIGMTIIMAYLFMFWGRFVFLNTDADFFWNRLDEVVKLHHLLQW